MRFLLDTNTVIALLNDRDSRVLKRLRKYSPDDVGVSSLVKHELYYGAFKSVRTEHNIAIVDGLRFEVLDFDNEDARETGAIRAALSAKGTPIGPYDTLIAGQARARGLTLVTHNTTEFSRVPHLRLQDWES